MHGSLPICSCLPYLGPLQVMFEKFGFEAAYVQVSERSCDGRMQYGCTLQAGCPSAASRACGAWCLLWVLFLQPVCLMHPWLPRCKLC